MRDPVPADPAQQSTRMISNSIRGSLGQQTVPELTWPSWHFDGMARSTSQRHARPYGPRKHDTHTLCIVSRGARSTPLVLWLLDRGSYVLPKSARRKVSRYTAAKRQPSRCAPHHYYYLIASASGGSLAGPLTAKWHNLGFTPAQHPGAPRHRGVFLAKPKPK